MRRSVVLSAVLSVAALSACSGGGSALNFGNGSATPTAVILTVQGASNIARVLPGAGLTISAVGVNGSSSGALLSNRFLWSARLTTGQQYVSNALGQMKPCASVMVTTAGVTTPLTTDFSIYIAIDPTNESNVILFPPTILPPPAGSTLTTNYPYCVLVTAAAITSPLTATTPVTGASGSILVEIADPQNPLQ